MNGGLDDAEGESISLISSTLTVAVGIRFAWPMT